MSAQLEKRYFSVDEYYRMAEAGVLKPDDRVELIEGEIIKMSPIGSPHAACVSRLNRLMHNQSRLQFTVSVQNPVRLSNFSEPVPDLVLLRFREDCYAITHPTPADVLLIIEVSDSTVLTDREIKLPLYARAGIRECWLVNLPGRVVEVHSQPVAGAFSALTEYRSGETVTSTLVADLTLDVDSILG